MTASTMHVGIIGYGLQGQSAARYWRDKGAQITICDINPNLQVPDWAQARLGKPYLSDLGSYDVIVRSPSVHPATLLQAGGSSVETKITTTTNEFFAACPSKNIIGVTGTKGKGTTSSLITEILQTAGKTVHLGGNIGIDPLELLTTPIYENDWVVLELANFQLIDIHHSPHIAVCLMAVPEHLNWHKDVTEYYWSKQQLFTHQKHTDIAVFNNRNDAAKAIIAETLAEKIPYDVPHPPFHRPFSKNGAYCERDVLYYQDSEVCSTADIALPGRHNIENVCAAIAATWDIIDGDTYVLKTAIANFKGLEHRIEFVNEVDGIAFFNDSFATTPEATLAVMRSFDQPKVMILGGSDKGVPLDPVIQEVLQSNVRHVIAIGDMGTIIASELLKHHYRHVTSGLTTMSDIVNTARDVAKKGDVVLLSTACASFGLFEDYKDRGNQFKACVKSL